MKINSIGPSFGASFVNNDKLKYLIERSGTDEKTQALVKQFTELPHKDKVEITYLYRCSIPSKTPYSIGVTNAESGKYVCLDVGNLNDLLKTLINDVNEGFWNNTEKYNKIIDQLTKD